MADEGGVEASEASANDAAPAVAASGIPAPVGPTCPWCSAPLGTVAPERCPTCGAGLVEDPEASVPGVTTIDPEAVSRAASWERIRRGASFRSFFESNREEMPTGEIEPSSLSALGPPSAEVRREMERLRAELAATAEREAELEALDQRALDDEIFAAAEVELETRTEQGAGPAATLVAAMEPEGGESEAAETHEAAATAVSTEVESPAEVSEARPATSSRKRRK
jgi:hypothetical protein